MRQVVLRRERKIPGIANNVDHGVGEVSIVEGADLGDVAYPMELRVEFEAERSSDAPLDGSAGGDGCKKREVKDEPHTYEDPPGWDSDYTSKRSVTGITISGFSVRSSLTSCMPSRVQRKALRFSGFSRNT